MTSDFYDPWEQFPYTGDVEAARDFIREDIQFNGVSTKYVVEALKQRDRVRVQLMLKGKPTKELRVRAGHGDYAEVVDDDGNEFHLWASTDSRSNPRVFNETWLRRAENDESAGIVSGITVLELS